MKDWPLQTLSEVCRFIDYRGKTPQKTTEGLRLITAKNVRMGHLNREPEEFMAASSYESWMTRGIPVKGDVLFTTEAPLGLVCQLDTDEKVAFAQRIITLQPDRNFYDPTFLKYTLSSFTLQKVIASLATGATAQGIKASLLKKIQIPAPPLAEQERIVAILDEAFESLATATAHTQQKLQNARELFQSTLQSTFQQKGDDWVETTLNDVCSITAKLVDPRETLFQDRFHVGGANIQSFTGELLNLLTAREEELISGKFPFDETMILYSKIRPYLLKVARPKFEGLCSADIYPLSPKPEILNRDFLFYLLLTQDFTDYAIAGSGRAGMPKVNRKHLFVYPFSLPPLPQQKTIVARLDALSTETRRLESLYQRQLAALAELKQSLLHQAFSGKL